MSSRLELRYRAALRWYPRAWRAANEDAVVGTLLDVAEGEGRSRPRAAELANLMVHGVAARAGRLPSAVPRALRDRTATAALAVGAAMALASTMQLEWNPTRFEDAGLEYSTFGPFASPMIVVYAAWVSAFFAAMAGYSPAARWITGATIPLTFAARAAADATDMVLRPTWTFLGILVLLAVLATGGTPAPPRAGVRWLLVWFLPALAVLTLPLSLIYPGGSAFQDPLWIDRGARATSMLGWLPAVALATAAALSAAGWRWWSATVLLIAAPVSAAVLLGGRDAPGEVVLWVALGTAALGAGLALLRVFGFRVRLERAGRGRPSATI